jgi:hypothetical protein
MTDMLDRDTIKTEIREAFAALDYPGDWCLRGSNEGEEPFLLEEEFRGKTNWQSLDPAFLDRAPNGFGSALSFFSDEAFRFYLPAYLIADMDGCLEFADPLFHLCHGLQDSSRSERVNPRRYGERTWWDEACHKFAMFTRPQAKAIVAYLQFRSQAEEIPDFRKPIGEALRNYWLSRATESPAFQEGSGSLTQP